MKPIEKLKIQSKTIWFFVITGSVAIAGVGLQYVEVIDLTPVRQMQAAMVFTTVQTLGGLWLRLITNKGVM